VSPDPAGPRLMDPDEETGLYYYGARYLNPRTSRWISADPAIDKYLPEVPKDNEARRRNRNLPGEGGVFNYVNLAVYHYGANNPLRYIDPTGSFEVIKQNRNLAAGIYGTYQSYMFVPLGGQLSNYQQQVRQLTETERALFGGTSAGAVMATMEAINSGEVGPAASALATQALGQKASIIGKIIAAFQALGAAIQKPNVGSTNYTTSPQQFEQMVKVEQEFTQRLIEEYKGSSDIILRPEFANESGTGSILNVQAYINYMQDLGAVLEQVRSSDQRFSEIEIIGLE
jgi:hypothetical protein